MTRRIAFVFLIFFAASIAWMLLAITIHQRTNNADSGLRSKVAGVWGSEQQQSPASASIVRKVRREVEVVVDGKKVKNWAEETELSPLELVQTRAEASIDLEPRQKGLLWYSTYKVTFSADYEFAPPMANEDVQISFSFPAQQAIYDDLKSHSTARPSAAPARERFGSQRQRRPPHCASISGIAPRG